MRFFIRQACVCRHFAASIYTHIAPRQNGKMAAHRRQRYSDYVVFVNQENSALPNLALTLTLTLDLTLT